MTRGLLTAASLGPLLAGAPAPARGAAPASAAVRDAVTARIAGSGGEVAVAFRLLDGSDELLLDPDAVFHAASTMKIPVMIELYRRADRGDLRLDEPLEVRNRFESIVDGSPYALSSEEGSEASLYGEVGGSVPLERLCRAMIQHSSNLATNLLIRRLGVERIRATTAALGAEGMHVLRGVEDGKAYRAGLSNTTTDRGLMRLLEAIANREAAAPGSCEAMERTLQGQHFLAGIPAGVPPGSPSRTRPGGSPASTTTRPSSAPRGRSSW